MSKIRFVVFDLGRVLFDFSFDSFIEFLESHGAVNRTPQSLIAELEGIAYEHGAISTETFLGNVSRLLSHKVDEKTIRREWQNIFRPNENMLELLSSMRSNYRVFILSNTNELHWEHLIAEFGIDTLSHGMVTSYETGAMKPHPKIFARAVSEFQLIPAETVFIDDIQDNILGAIRAGWRGIHHKSFEETLKTLEELGCIVDRALIQSKT